MPPPTYFLDSFAHYRRAVGLPMLSINWGAWDVMRRFTRQDRDRFSQGGLLPMESDKLFQLIGELFHLSARRSWLPTWTGTL